MLGNAAGWVFWSLVIACCMTLIVFVEALGSQTGLPRRRGILPSMSTVPVVLILLLGFLFYYSLPLISFFWRLKLQAALQLTIRNSIVASLLEYREFVLGAFPDPIIKEIPWPGGSIPIELLTKNTYFGPTLWPVLVLLIAIGLRIAIWRFVPHEKLRRVSAKYWLYFTGYAILAVMLSAVVGTRVFIAVTALVVLVGLVLAAGFFEVLKDILVATEEALHLIYRAGRIAVMAITWVAVRIAKIARRIARSVRMMYQKYIVAPLRRARDFIVTRILQPCEDWLKLKLDQERLDEDD